MRQKFNEVLNAIGGVIAPPRFVAFLIVLSAACLVGIPALGWRMGFMLGFDLAALVFLGSCVALLNDDPVEMRQRARTNDANRALLLALTGLVTLVILVAVASILSEGPAHSWVDLLEIVVTLMLAWAFSNMVYTLHYAHIYYESTDGEADRGGLSFPDTTEPNYIDFVYFSFCLGMAFQTADVVVKNSHMRAIVTIHCMAAFIFNIGIVAFTFNVIGGWE